MLTNSLMKAAHSTVRDTDVNPYAAELVLDDDRSLDALIIALIHQYGEGKGLPSF